MRASVLSPKYDVFCCDQNGPPARREEGAYLNPYVTDEQRGRRPIFIATLRAGASWLFFRVARSTRMTQIWVLRSRLEKQPTDLRQYTCYFGDRTLTHEGVGPCLCEAPAFASVFAKLQLLPLISASSSRQRQNLEFSLTSGQILRQTLSQFRTCSEEYALYGRDCRPHDFCNFFVRHFLVTSQDDCHALGFRQPIDRVLNR